MSEAIKEAKDIIEAWNVLGIAEDMENGWERDVMISVVKLFFTFITTIESLQEEIQVNKNVDGFNWKQQLEERERLQNCVQSLQREISSHAPDGRNYINGQYVDLLLKFESQKEEIERLQALITGEIKWLRTNDFNFPAKSLEMRFLQEGDK